MVNKKAYIKTLEALVALVIFLIFVTGVIVINQPREKETIPQDIKLLQDTILNKIETEPEFRHCLVANDTICIENLINSSILPTIDYDFDICNEPNPSDCTLKTFPLNRTIYADSLIIQEGKTAIIRLYLWRKVE
jgi:hypothetical protein